MAFPTQGRLHPPFFTTFPPGPGEERKESSLLSQGGGQAAEAGCRVKRPAPLQPGPPPTPLLRSAEAKGREARLPPGRDA